MSNQQKYPTTRLRRTRASDWSRRLVAENSLSVNDLIWPIFIREGNQVAQEIVSMPGVERMSLDLLLPAVEKAANLGIPAIALFPNTPNELRDDKGSEALNSKNLINRAMRAIKAEFPNIGVIADVALDPYTAHGHDGLLIGDTIDNDKTIEVLIKQSLTQAEAGCDILAPSDMMDGRVGAIRTALDKAGFEHVQIMAYAAKYASAFYGPFRDAVGSGGVLKGDKKTYQMSPANSDEAMREIAMDINEGADSIIVKPGMPYLDIIKRATETFEIPTFAYQVSGEYSMLHAAAKNGWMDIEAVMLETLLSFKRAGAAGVLTYFAIKAAETIHRR